MKKANIPARYKDLKMNSRADAEPEKQPKTGSSSFEKIFFDTLVEVAGILGVPRRKKTRRIKDRIVQADSFTERDEVVRSLAGRAYEVALKFEEEGDREQQLKWLKLVARLLELSLEPKKLADLEEIKRALAEIKKEQAAQA